MKAEKHLTYRELQVLRLICKERRTVEIAKHLEITPKTVETHRRHIMLKLNIFNVIGLYKWAVKNELVKA